jgi:hypothetical protein
MEQLHLKDKHMSDIHIDTTAIAPEAFASLGGGRVAYVKTVKSPARCSARG